MSPNSQTKLVDRHAQFTDAGPRSTSASLESANREQPELIEGGSALPSHLMGAVIALGNFDGFHIGHQAVVGRAVELARSRGVAAIVATFDPHPVRYFKPHAAPFRLTSLEQRRALFGDAGVHALMVCAFDRLLAEQAPEAFVANWISGASGIVTGEDFVFGRGRSGNLPILRELCARQGMSCDGTELVERGGHIVSSTRIREALHDGDCGGASDLLGRPFALEGQLAEDHREAASRFLIDLGDYVRPRDGVYAVRVRNYAGNSHQALASFDSSSTSTSDIALISDAPAVRSFVGSAVELAILQPLAEQASRLAQIEEHLSPQDGGRGSAHC